MSNPTMKQLYSLIYRCCTKSRSRSRAAPLCFSVQLPTLSGTPFDTIPAATTRPFCFKVFQSFQAHGNRQLWRRGILNAVLGQLDRHEPREAYFSTFASAMPRTNPPFRSWLLRRKAPSGGFCSSFYLPADFHWDRLDVLARVYA